MNFRQYKTYKNCWGKLPPGDGYIIKILGIDVCQNRKGNGQCLRVTFDIADGLYKGHFMKDYEHQRKAHKQWHGYYYMSLPDKCGRNRKFHAFISNIESSNPGYQYSGNFNSIVGRVVGGIFEYRTYRRHHGHLEHAVGLVETYPVVFEENSYLPDEKQENAAKSAWHQDLNLELEIIYDSSPVKY